LNPVALILLVACGDLRAADIPLPRRAEVMTAWGDYRQNFIQGDGRVIDRADAHVSTSEGQSYALARSVWVNDRESFERVLRWTRDNLQGGDPGALPAWRWGRRPDGVWGVLDPQPAADADLLIAWSLLVAARRWGEPTYRLQARALLSQVWEKETLLVGEGTPRARRLLLPGPWAVHESPVRVNPSYYLPFAFRLFAVEDPAHDWGAFVAESYRVFAETARPDGLPPDWAGWDLEAGAWAPPTKAGEHHDAFGYESFRVVWTLAAELIWFDDSRARAALARVEPLVARFEEDGALPAVILADGSPGRPYPFLGMYGALLPAWGRTHPDTARRLYEGVIFPTRSVSGWGNTEDYYAQNWVWFGLALFAAPAPDRTWMAAIRPEDTE